MAEGAEADAPPVGEELHLPGASLVPILNALGLALILVGLAVGIVVSIAGAVLFVVTLVRWVRDTRRDIDELPLMHHSD